MPFFFLLRLFEILFFFLEKTKLKASYSLGPPAETSIFPGPCTRTTPGTTTRRPAAAAPRRSSQTPSQVAAARSEVRSLPQATRYLKTAAPFTEGSVYLLYFRVSFRLNAYYCLVLFNLGIRRVAWGKTMNPVTQIPFVFQERRRKCFAD